MNSLLMYIGAAFTAGCIITVAGIWLFGRSLKGIVDQLKELKANAALLESLRLERKKSAMLESQTIELKDQNRLLKQEVSLLQLRLKDAEEREERQAAELAQAVARMNEKYALWDAQYKELIQLKARIGELPSK